MVRSDYFDDYRNLPDYYPTMYKDGFTFDQVYAASMITGAKKYREQRKQQRQKSLEEIELNITTEVNIKR